jgi:hypothetical protein
MISVCPKCRYPTIVTVNYGFKVNGILLLVTRRTLTGARHGGLTIALDYAEVFCVSSC